MFEPPQSVLGDTGEPDTSTGNVASANASVGGDTTPKPQLKRTNTAKRKDSMASMTGFAGHLSEYLHEHGADDIAGRLEAVEASTKRIEEMLRKISQDMGEDDSESSERPRGTREENSDVFEEGVSP